MLTILVGLPGSGKSTIGRSLGQRLRLPFVDSDKLIEQQLGCGIREFFEREGEPRFRQVEHEVLARAAADLETGVLATGGGSVLREDNRRLLCDAGCVVYLHASADELFRRLRRDTHRPLLQVTDPHQRLRDLYAQRDPLYRECARFSVDTGRASVHALVQKIAMQLELAGIVARD